MLVTKVTRYSPPYVLVDLKCVFFKCARPRVRARALVVCSQASGTEKPTRPLTDLALVVVMLVTMCDVLMPLWWWWRCGRRSHCLIPEGPSPPSPPPPSQPRTPPPPRCHLLNTSHTQRPAKGPTRDRLAPRIGLQCSVMDLMGMMMTTTVVVAVMAVALMMAALMARAMGSDG